MSKPDRHQPRPPELLSPWRTDARARLQKEARDFARDVVLPIADGNPAYLDWIARETRTPEPAISTTGAS